MKNIKYCNPPVAAVPQQQQQQQQPTRYGLTVFKEKDGVATSVNFVDENGNALIIGCILLLWWLVSRLGKSTTTTTTRGRTGNSSYLSDIIVRHPFDEKPRQKYLEPCKSDFWK